MLSDYYSYNLEINDITFEDVEDNKRTWIGTIKISGIGEITILIENMYNIVFLISDNETKIIFQSKAPPPWDKSYSYKTWIYSYMLTK